MVLSPRHVSFHMAQTCRILRNSVSNRGRRPTYITHVARIANVWRGTGEVSADLMQQLANPRKLDESESATLVHGQLGGTGTARFPSAAGTRSMAPIGDTRSQNGTGRSSRRSFSGPITLAILLAFAPLVAPTPTERPRFQGLSEADEGTRTRDLLHGKEGARADWRRL
jgi:hypothetical protein